MSFVELVPGLLAIGMAARLVSAAALLVLFFEVRALRR